MRSEQSLVERLLSLKGDAALLREAAARIESLERERDKLIGALSGALHVGQDMVSTYMQGEDWKSQPGMKAHQKRLDVGHKVLADLARPAAGEEGSNG